MQHKKQKTVHEACSLGQRLRWLREYRGFTLRQAAELVLCDPGYLSKLETGKVLNPSDRFLASIVLSFRVNGAWLRNGEGDPFEPVMDSSTQKALADWSEKRIGQVIQVLPDLPEALAANLVLGLLLRDEDPDELRERLKKFRDAFPSLPIPARLFWSEVLMAFQLSDQWPSKQTRNIQLTNVPKSENMSSVKTEMQRLLDKVRKLAEPRGKQSALAEFLQVQTSRVSEWLSGKCEPGGQNTLRLVQWAEQQERQQQESPGHVPARPEPKAQRKRERKCNPELQTPVKVTTTATTRKP